MGPPSSWDLRTFPINCIVYTIDSHTMRHLRVPLSPHSIRAFNSFASLKETLIRGHLGAMIEHGPQEAIVPCITDRVSLAIATDCG